MLVEIGILHDSPPFGGQVYHALLPTEIPEGPQEEAPTARAELTPSGSRPGFEQKRSRWQ
jgi:hypothetical protein